MFGICNLSIIPMRFEPSDRSEIVSQVLFGEHFEIIDTVTTNGQKLNCILTNYEGWVDSKQYQIISEENYKLLSKTRLILNCRFG
jgi:gamma-D-glutamyl-L-lysine dipeptidyl-peptidase